jgi:hypothetical protein
VVASIAVIRRIRVITAELTKLPESSPAIFQRAMSELGLLSVMVLILVGALILLQRQKKINRHEWMVSCVLKQEASKECFFFALA